MDTQQGSRRSDGAWNEKVEAHRALLARRGFALSTECIPPVGQAADWYWDAIRYVPRSGQHVARQIARLCGEDSEVTVPWRSLTDAVGMADKSGRTRAYVESGVDMLKRGGWLKVVTLGKGCAAKTTFGLLAGERDYWLDIDVAEEAMLDELETLGAAA